MAEHINPSFKSLRQPSALSQTWLALLFATALAFAPVGMPAFADTAASAMTDLSKGAAREDDKGTAVASGDTAGVDAAASSVTTGSIVREPTYAQRMRECMEIWDPGTRMTKKQWRRSCRDTLRSLKW